MYIVFNAGFDLCEAKKKRLGGVNSEVLQRIDTIQYCDEI